MGRVGGSPPVGSRMDDHLTGLSVVGVSNKFPFLPRVQRACGYSCSAVVLVIDPP